jgi:hypothetical protein
MKMINIQYVSDEALETFKRNISKITKRIQENPGNNGWVDTILPNNPFVVKKFKIIDFELKTDRNGIYKNVDYENSIMLYENLKHLPDYVLTDERFWLWLYLAKFYQVATQAIPIKSESTVKNHWLFSPGKRRGIFFGVLSRCYYRVALSVNEKLDDKYELTKYVVENPIRFRELSWRSYSSQKHIVLAVLRAQKEGEMKFKDKFSSKFYPIIAKRISRYGSVRLLDVISENEIFSEVENTITNLVKEYSKS